jgi:site-specific DNA recombinase
MEADAIRCAIYVRVSLDSTGEQLAITRQLEDCRKIAHARGWVIVAEYPDNSISAFKEKDRPKYNEMTTDYQRCAFDAIIVWDLDRLTRQPKQLEDWVEAAEKRGLLLVTVTGDVDLSSHNGRLYARIKAAAARSEMEMKSARQARAARQRAEHGKVPKGVRLTGYTLDGEVVEAEATLVREIFARFHAGDSLKGIARYLSETGVKTRHGKPWNPSTVSSILRNPRYCGRVYYNRRENGTTGDWAPAAFPAIVEEHVWDAINARLADPRRRKAYNTDRKYLGSGLYLCGKCEERVRAHYLGGRPGYRCPAGCVNRSAAAIDQAVEALVQARLSQPDVAQLVSKPTGKEATDAAAEVRRQRNRLTQVEADYDADLIDGKRYKEKCAKIKAQLEAAEVRLTQLTAGSEVAGILTAPNVAAAFNAAPLGVRQAVTRFFMEVQLLAAPRGRRGFDPQTIQITPRHPVTPRLHAASSETTAAS